MLCGGGKRGGFERGGALDQASYLITERLKEKKLDEGHRDNGFSDLTQKGKKKGPFERVVGGRNETVAGERAQQDKTSTSNY